MRDLGMEGHSERIASLAAALAVRLGLDEADAETLRLGARLHDIGKVGVPAEILLKPGPLDDRERALVQLHPLIGDRLLEPLPALAAVRPIVRHHHERWDGLGYPAGLAGASIPLAARIVAVADAIDAMSAPRQYRGALAPAEILAELSDGRGTQWDPAVVDAALDLVDAGEVALVVAKHLVSVEGGGYLDELTARVRSLVLVEAKAA